MKEIIHALLAKATEKFRAACHPFRRYITIAKEVSALALTTFGLALVCQNFSQVLTCGMGRHSAFDAVPRVLVHYANSMRDFIGMLAALLLLLVICLMADAGVLESARRRVVSPGLGLVGHMVTVATGATAFKMFQTTPLTFLQSHPEEGVGLAAVLGMMLMFAWMAVSLGEFFHSPGKDANGKPLRSDYDDLKAGLPNWLMVGVGVMLLIGFFQQVVFVNYAALDNRGEIEAPLVCPR